MADIALGISKIEYGMVGDGVPSASFTQITDYIAEGSVSFNFSDPTETTIMAETSDVPVHVILTKEDPEYIDFSLISPASLTMGVLAGGVVNGDAWDSPSAVPEINKTIKVTTKLVGGKYYEYIIVNAKIVAKLSQAPSKKAEEQVLVRCYVQEAKSLNGQVNTPFIRKKVAEIIIPTLPEFYYAEVGLVNDTSLILTADRVLNTFSVPNISDFYIEKNGTTPVALSGISILNDKVTFTIDAIEKNDVLFITYTKGTVPFIDNDLNEMDSFSEMFIINNVGANVWDDSDTWNDSDTWED